MKITILFWLLTAMSTLVNAIEIEVFTNENYRIYPGDYEITEYDLDEKLRIEDELSKGLPADPKKAMEMARQMFNDPAFMKTVNKLKSVNLRFIAAFNYQLDKIPAIVIDHKYILYGMTDVNRAMAIYYEHSEQ